VAGPRRRPAFTRHRLAYADILPAVSIREQLRKRAPKAVAAMKHLPGVKKWLDAHPPREPHVERAIRSHVRSGDLVVDVGAHRGTLTRVLADCVGPVGNVVAFEANAETANKLREKFEGDERIHVEHAAVSDQPGSARLYPGREKRSAEWSLTDRYGASESIEVSTVTLDGYFEDEPPAVLKIDAEGAEAKVLRGMTRILTEHRPALIIEFHSDGGTDAVGVLRAHGYDLVDAATNQEVGLDFPSYFHGLAIWSSHE